MSCDMMAGEVSQIHYETSSPSIGSESDGNISGWGSSVSEVTENTPPLTEKCQPWETFQETRLLDQIQCSPWSSSSDDKETDRRRTAKTAAKVADDWDNGWEERQAQLAKLEARRRARERRSRPWLHNSVLRPPQPKGLLKQFEALAASALGFVTTRAEKNSDSSSLLTRLANGHSLNVDTLDYLQPDRVAESLNFLEEVLGSLNVIGRVCRISFAAKEGNPLEKPLCIGLAAGQSNTDASDLGLIVQIGDNLLESYSQICSAIDEGNEQWWDNLCLIYKLLAGEDFPHVTTLLGHHLGRQCGSQYLDQIRTDKEVWVGMIIDYDFLKDFSWSLVQLLKDTYTIMRICDTSTLSVAAKEELSMLRELTKRHLARVDILYAEDVTEEQGSIFASSQDDRTPEMSCSSLVRSFRRCNFRKTRRAIAREMPHLQNLVDTETGQIETVEAASHLSQKALTRLYKHFEGAVRRFLNVTPGRGSGWRDIHIKARYLRRERAFVPPEVRRALDLTIHYRQALTLQFEAEFGFDRRDGHRPYTSQLCRAREEFNGIDEDNVKLGRLRRQLRYPLSGPFDHGRETKYIRKLSFGPAISMVIATRQERFRTMLHSLDLGSTHFHYCPPLKALHDWLSITKDVPKSMNSLVDKYLVPLSEFLPHDIFLATLENAIDERLRLNYVPRRKCSCRPPSPEPDYSVWI